MEIIWGIFDDRNKAITGGAANTTLKVRREADGFLYDWNDSTFKSSGWTSLTAALAEDDATNNAGFYTKSVTTTSWDDGNYLFITRYSDAVTRNGVEQVLVKNGGTTVLEDLHDEAFGKWSMDTTANTLTLYKADGTTTLKVFDLTATSSTVSVYVTRTPQ